jgi:endonuclease G
MGHLWEEGQSAVITPAKVLVAILILVSHLSLAAAEVVSGVGPTLLRLDYQGFTVWLDCERRGAVKFRYNAQRDQGDFKRQKTFYLDPNVPKRCQQTSTAAYQHDGARYDRGHLVPANHLDNDAKAIKQSNYMTNILPQAANMNRCAWLRTEEITECYRDIDELLVLGGVIWGDDVTDDYFVASHGVATPDAFWKLIIRGKDRDIAWIVPNTQAATYKCLDDYLVTVEELEQRTGEHFPEVPAFRRAEKPEGSWTVPMGCDKS